MAEEAQVQPKGIELRKVAVFFCVVVFMALAVNGASSLYVRHLHKQTLVAQDNRQHSLAITEEIQREAENLSWMVRAYTSSGDNRFLRYYFAIKEIRDGVRPVPKDYGATFWAQVVAGEREYDPQDMPPQGNTGGSIRERMVQRNFAPEEFRALDTILKRSEILAKQELIAFQATQGLYDPETGGFYEDGVPLKNFAHQLVYSKAYLKLESAVMHSIEDFTAMTDSRTRDQVLSLSQRLSQSIVISNVILGLTVVMVIASVLFLRRMVLSPIQDLSDTALKFGGGDYRARSDDQRGCNELRTMERTFNMMADNIEKDIAQREEIQRELEATTARAEDLSRIKSLFLANMSHEIRTPMNAIIGMIYLLENTQIDNRQKDYLDKIHRAAQSLLGIINDILDFSKIEAGKLDLEKVPFSLEGVIDNSLTILREQALRKEVELLLDIRDSSLIGASGWFWGDPLRLGQVLTNLLSNAVKFTEKGHVLMRVEDFRAGDTDHLRLTISDTGIGMTPEQVGKLFQEFTQADGSTTRRHGGTGLGLSISKRLLDLMGGTIEVRSEFGKGSEFVCTLPLGRAPGQGERDDAGLGCGLKALVVDDHAAAREVLRELLAMFRISCAEADSGAEALALLAAPGAHFDMVFIDWMMPEMNGEQLIIAIHDLKMPVKPMLTVVSGYDLERINEMCGELGVCGYLPKPVLPNEMRRFIRAARGLEGAIAVRGQELNDVALKGMRVLLVEDNLINQQIAVEMLQPYGIGIDVAGNGRQALETLAGRAADYYHLVLLDIQMPVMDGYETIRHIRGDEKLAQLPVVAMTAHAMREEKERCLALGMNGHIAKPFDIRALLRLLASYYQSEDKGGAANALTDKMPDKRAIEFIPLGLAISGVDLAKGIEHCAGNTVLYGNVLKRFTSDCANLTETLNELLQAGRFHDLLVAAHTAKGLARTIGAMAVADIAEAIEVAAERQAPTLSPLIKELDWQLTPIVAALNARFAADADRVARLIADEPVSVGTVTAEVGTAEAREDLLPRLRTLLASSDIQVQDFWRQHEKSWVVVLDTNLRQKVGRAIDSFNFIEALRLLDQEIS